LKSKVSIGGENSAQTKPPSGTNGGKTSARQGSASGAETIPTNKKRKRSDLEESNEHEDQIEKLGKLNAGNKIRKTESLDKII
jgi:hypothetical protein